MYAECIAVRVACEFSKLAFVCCEVFCMLCSELVRFV